MYGIEKFFGMREHGTAYSISEGIAFGMLSYVLIKLFTGKWKQISILLYILAFLFILKHVL
jgi:adenine/guanine/hypoxanthine permease